MNAPNSSTITLLVLLPLIAWRVCWRFRRMVGRQRLSKVRLWITLAIYFTFVVLLGFATHTHPERLWWLAGGLGLGSLLGVYGLKKTSFEPTPKGLYYTPNARLGIALSVLFVARLVYRFVEISATTPVGSHGTNDFARSPLTLAVFGLLAGYYMTYALGLLRWRLRLLRAKRQREALKLENRGNDA